MAKQHYCNKEKELGEMGKDIAWIKEKVDNIDKSLNGNGQPGFRQRLIILENWKYYTIGCVAVIVFVINYVMR